MMRRVLALAACFVFSLTAACAPAGQRPDVGSNQITYGNNHNSQSAYDYVNRETPSGIGFGPQYPVGYIRYQAENGQRADRVSNIYVDRNVLARQIAKLVAQLGIKDSAVLVTDDHVFVGINGNQELDFQSLRRIQQTALSVTPRYYRVHVIQDPSMVRRINEAGTGRGDLQRLLRDLGDTTLPGVVR